MISHDVMTYITEHTIFMPNYFTSKSSLGIAYSQCNDVEIIIQAIRVLNVAVHMYRGKLTEKKYIFRNCLIAIMRKHNSRFFDVSLNAQFFELFHL